jgi:hypothetical protein
MLEPLKNVGFGVPLEGELNEGDSPHVMVASESPESRREKMSEMPEIIAADISKTNLIPRLDIRHQVTEP